MRPTAGQEPADTTAGRFRPPLVGCLLLRHHGACPRASCTGHGGVILEQLKVAALHLDIDREDRFLLVHQH